LVELGGEPSLPGQISLRGLEIAVVAVVDEKEVVHGLGIGRLSGAGNKRNTVLVPFPLAACDPTYVQYAGLPQIQSGERGRLGVADENDRRVVLVFAKPGSRRPAGTLQVGGPIDE